jgi:hypothetical protein
MDADNNKMLNKTIFISTEEKKMNGKRSDLGIIISIIVMVIIGIVTVAPVGATPLPLAQVDPFGDGSVLMNVSAQQVGGGNYQFNYNIQNPGASLFQVSIGTTNPETSENYGVVSYDLPAPAHQTYSRLAVNALMVYFLPYPGLPQNWTGPTGPGYDLSLTTASFIDSQWITIRSGAARITIQPTYSSLPAHTPEPATLLLVGSGLLGLGFFSRRKRKKS